MKIAIYVRSFAQFFRFLRQKVKEALLAISVENMWYFIVPLGSRGKKNELIFLGFYV